MYIDKLDLWKEHYHHITAYAKEHSVNPTTRRLEGYQEALSEANDLVLEEVKNLLEETNILSAVETFITTGWNMFSPDDENINSLMVEVITNKINSTLDSLRKGPQI